MRRDLENRLQAIETARAGAGTVQIWIEQSDGMLRGPRGEVICRDEFEVRSSGVGTVVVLPDNGRDPIGRGDLRVVISEDDARL
jgi:hypothetical protein